MGLEHYKNETSMTEIVVFDRRGKIVFRCVEPRLMTSYQVERELKEWCVDKDTHKVQIIYQE